MLVDALRRLDQAGVTLTDVGLRRPTLDDAFLNLTGHLSNDASPPPDGARPPGLAARPADETQWSIPNEPTKEGSR